MRQDFYLHIIASIAIFYLFRKFALLVAIQVGKEIYDFIDYGGFDVLDWWGDFSAVILIMIIKKL